MRGLIRLRAEERGASLAIVGISLLCLLGMLVLTFDLGRGVAIKRNMVNAADAAALAAARECGLGNGIGDAEDAAKQLLGENNASATLTDIEFDSEAQCSGIPSDGERQVTVTTSVSQEYFFAQIFGFDQGTVTASATAEWTIGETSPAPLKLDELKVEQCVEEGTPTPEGRIDCWFTFEKSAAPLNSDWGWLNLPEGWPIKDKDANPPTCNSQKGGSKDLSDYIGSMGGLGDPGKQFQAGLWDPTGAGNPPTWVCGSTGLKQDSVDAIQAWVDDVTNMMEDGTLQVEPFVVFPIVACDSADPLADSTCREWKYTPGVAYPVVNLQAFYVKGAWQKPHIPPADRPHCDCTRSGSSDSFCVHLQTTRPDEQQQSGGAVKVWLVD